VGDMLLIGFDLRKDLQKLHAAYFDSLNVTSRFNINLLNRMNKELGANFDTTKWQHRAGIIMFYFLDCF
jgi:L-histidine N-alpha-methyltransferase